MWSKNGDGSLKMIIIYASCGVGDTHIHTHTVNMIFPAYQKNKYNICRDCVHS